MIAAKNFRHLLWRSYPEVAYLQSVDLDILEQQVVGLDHRGATANSMTANGTLR
jgi:hypothetical protein